MSISSFKSYKDLSMIYPSVVGVDDDNLCCRGAEETDYRDREAVHGFIVGLILTLQSPNG